MSDCPTLSVAKEKYFKHAYDLSPRTQQIYTNHLDRLIGQVGDLPVDQVDRHLLTEFMNNLKPKNGGKYSTGFLSQIFRALHTFFEYCVLEEWLSANPLQRVRRPKLELGPRPRLQLHQVHQLLEAVETTDLRERNLAIVLLMVDSGLRRGEVANLRIRDVMLEEKRVYVRTNKTHSTREVPISQKTIAALKEYRAVRPPYADDHDPLFLNKIGRPLTSNTLGLLMRRLKKKVDFSLHAHLLRHTFAGIYNKKGNLKKLQKILGHSSIETTARFYVDPDFDELQEEHEVAAPTSQIFGAPRRSAGTPLIDPSRLKLADLIQEYLGAASDEDLSKNTVYRYRGFLIEMVNWLAAKGIIYLNDLSRAWLKTWQNEVVDPLTPGTARIAIAAARSFLKWCHQEKLIGQNLGPALTFPNSSSPE